MNNFAPNLSRGWKERRAKADRTDYDADGRVEARAARASLYASNEAASRAAVAAAEAARASARCSCPACGEGLVAVDFAGRIVTALEKLPANVVIDPAVVQALLAAVETPVAADPVHGVSSPVPVPHAPKHRRKPTPAEIYAAGDDGVVEDD
ncbi:hypothetical protein MKK55_11280 [Methylobacterium sp. J-059]|uniref:hypothetical protein n=1 Tax=Methylobacterium sp. J-059 TaxID=2836643 RepID=UPI001FBBB297|nr:hypothetical protein [Methylobacterium sp. J-059]MCJ2039517.1 hypothetical protein [Methylobacterium sp. J-059]